MNVYYSCLTHLKYHKVTNIFVYYVFSHSVLCQSGLGVPAFGLESQQKALEVEVKSKEAKMKKKENNEVLEGERTQDRDIPKGSRRERRY